MFNVVATTNTAADVGAGATFCRLMESPFRCTHSFSNGAGLFCRSVSFGSLRKVVNLR